jgi:hypothetical protein
MDGSSIPPRIEPAEAIRDWTTAPENVLSPARNLVPVAVAFCAIALVCVSAKFCLDQGIAWRCPMMQAFHLPCPSCGTTRAFAALWELRFGDAWRLNPLMVSAIPLSAIGYLFRRRLARYEQWGWAMLGIAVCVNWIYLLLYLPR